MKTSTKLLIGLLALILIIDIYVLIYIRVIYEGTQKGFELPDFEYSDDMVQKETKLENFNKIIVDGPARIYYYQSDSCKIIIHSSKRMAERLEYKVFDNTLNINIDNLNPKKEQGEIKVYCDSLIFIALMKGAHFEANGINGDECKITLENSVLNGYFNLKDLLQINQDSRSRVSVEGKSERINISSDRYSIINALDLETNNAVIKASGSSNIDVNVSNSMKIDISENSILRYKGKPIIESIIIDSGAKILEINESEIK